MGEKSAPMPLQTAGPGSVAVERPCSIVLVVGLSGAGKSAAMDTLSDLGFVSVEHLPVPLFKNFLEFLTRSSKPVQKAALSMDLDTVLKQEQLLSLLVSMRGEARALEGLSLAVLFLDAKVETIIRRYGQTRRPHPGFDPDRDKTIEETICRERDRLFPLREVADRVIDTSELNVHQLRSEVRDFAASCHEGPTKPMRVTFLSFGFKHGVPIDCDLLADVRFLPNPYFVDLLRDFSGLDTPVAEFVFESGVATDFAGRYMDLLGFLLPKFVESGKSYVTIGVGCTGGRHRSVALCEWMAKQLAERLPSAQFVIGAKHRDIHAPSQ